MKKETLKVLGINLYEDVNAEDLFRLNRDELMEPEMAYKVEALRELCEEANATKEHQKVSIRSSKDVAAVLGPHMRYLDHEECWVLFLSTDNKILQKRKMTTGSNINCLFDVQGIARQALLLQASGIIVSHNHPSGNPTPSKADMDETEKLRKALNVLQIQVLDHIIMSDYKYYSFADEETYNL